MTKWPHHPNLRKKPHAPSKGRGPVQRAIRRVFMASGAEVLNSTEIYDWAHGRRRFGRRKSMPFGVYSRTLRTLRAMCEPVGRAPTIGSARHAMTKWPNHPNLRKKPHAPYAHQRERQRR
jgi:hypothetical protein